MGDMEHSEFGRLVARLGVSVVVVGEPVGAAPWDSASHGWRCELRFAGNAYAFDYWAGSAIKGDPQMWPLEVVDNLLSDAWSYMQADDVLDFASEFGIDLSDDAGRTAARRTFEGCKQTAEGLSAMLGAETLEALAQADRNEDES